MGVSFFDCNLRGKAVRILPLKWGALWETISSKGLTREIKDAIMKMLQKKTNNGGCYEILFQMRQSIRR